MFMYTLNAHTPESIKPLINIKLEADDEWLWIRGEVGFLTAERFSCRQIELKFLLISFNRTKLVNGANSEVDP